jgi:hypothetical protein
VRRSKIDREQATMVLLDDGSESTAGRALKPEDEVGFGSIATKKGR